MIRRIAMGLGAALSIALLAAPSEAAITWNLKPSGTGNWDWNLRGVYQRYDTNDDSPLPFAAVYGFVWENAADHCIEISTGPGRFTSNPDTRIWVRSGVFGSWQSVNDDFAQTLQATARFWISFPTPNFGEYGIKIAPWGSGGVYDDYEVIVTHRDVSEANCTTNQTTIPWAKIIGNGTQSNTIILSPNAS